MGNFAKLFFSPPDDLGAGLESAGKDAGDVAAAPVEGASAAVEHVADTLQGAAQEASAAARESMSEREHEVLSGVAQALDLLRSELQRANDLREFEANKAREVVSQAEETAAAPIAEIVEEKPNKRRVRRGARKVER